MAVPPWIKDSLPQKDSNEPGVKDLYKSEDVFVNNANVVLYDPPAGATGSGADATVLIEAEGPLAPIDDLVEGGGDPSDGALIAGQSDPGDVGNPNDSDTSGPSGSPPPPLSPGCQDISGVNYNYRLSPNYTLANFSTGALFRHPIQAQGGRSTSQIICNLKGLSLNITERLRAQYPGFRINSGFRRGSGSSQHERGMAMDVQWPGMAPRAYLPIAQWCKNNLNFDQLIFEHGNTIWIHLSYDTGKTNQRRQVLTMYRGRYTSGLKLYY
jgi:hypothetical protein